MASFQDRLDSIGNPVKMHGTPQPPAVPSPYPPVHTNWQAEQKALESGATLFDQSYHMTDLYITGPDMIKLLSDTSVNSYTNFGANKAKQYLAVNNEGYAIGDSILFGLSDDEAVNVGAPITSNWLQYQAEVGNYDVQFRREELSLDGATKKSLYRYNIEGPNALKILEKASGGKLEPIKFFAMGEFPVEGHTVRALNHTMGGVPGQEMTGLELFGPSEEAEAVLGAILEAGKDLGLLRGGSLSYGSTVLDSGWLAFVIPAIYGEEYRGYREWLPEYSMEGFFPITGSFRSDNIEDYYTNPWDLGYGHMIKFDHEFIGREALEKMAEQPNKNRKVWLTWNDEDAARVIASSQMGGESGAKQLLLPIFPGTYDQILIGDRRIGLATMHGYTDRIGHMASIGWAAEDDAIDGTEVELLWGDPDGGASNPYVANHTQTRVRATLTTSSPLA